MIITFKPEDGDEQRFQFNPRKIRATDAERIERRYGGRWNLWIDDVTQGGIGARRVLLWFLTQRQHPGFRWEDTPDFCMDELVVELDQVELQRARDAVAARTDLAPEMAALALTALDEQIAAAPAPLDGDPGKANANSAA